MVVAGKMKTGGGAGRGGEPCNMLRLLSEATRPLRMLNVRWLMMLMMMKCLGQLSHHMMQFDL
jgi:hypothetical protein